MPGEPDAVIVSLARWTADTKQAAAAQARTRERWLRQQAEETATLASLLWDLAEVAAVVSVRTTAGRQHRGTLRVVGADFVALDAGGAIVFIPFRAVGMVAPPPGARLTPAHSRPAPARPTLTTVLANLAAERAVVTVVAGATTITGELRAVGADVLTLDAGGPRYVPVASLYELSVRVSG